MEMWGGRAELSKKITDNVQKNEKYITTNYRFKAVVDEVIILGDCLLNGIC